MLLNGEIVFISGLDWLWKVDDFGTHGTFQYGPSYRARPLLTHAIVVRCSNQFEIVRKDGFDIVQLRQTPLAAPSVINNNQPKLPLKEMAIT